jgi:hypothetical protein
VLLIGGIGVVDLRLAGAFRALPLAALARALTPLAAAGVALLAASGTILFAADARALVASPAFRLKLALIGLALANAGLFRLWSHGRLVGWRQVPRSAAVAAMLSLLLWLGVAAAGRLIAYL